jgi:hypothetical protein
MLGRRRRSVLGRTKVLRLNSLHTVGSLSRLDHHRMAMGVAVAVVAVVVLVVLVVLVAAGARGRGSGVTRAGGGRIAG